MPRPTVTKVFRKFANILKKSFEKCFFIDLSKSVFLSFLTSLKFFRELSEKAPRISQKFADENVCDFCLKLFFCSFSKDFQMSTSLISRKYRVLSRDLPIRMVIYGPSILQSDWIV